TFKGIVVFSAARRLRDRRVRSTGMRAAQKVLLAGGLLAEHEKDLVRRVSLALHDNDGMFDDADHYLRVGLSAVRCIDHAMGCAPASVVPRDVRSVLDLPC